MPTVAPTPAFASRIGTYMVIFGVVPALTVVIVPSIRRASDENDPYDALGVPFAFSMPLFHGLPELSRNVNQMNIWTFVSFRAIVSACLAYDAWSEVLMPLGCAGFVSWPYSVIQIGTDRWNSCFRPFSNVGIVESVTFG